MNRDLPEGVAIVGMAGRFPGAATIEQFWDNLLAGRESISRFSPDELSPSVPPELRNHPRYVPARGVIDDADRFDAAFFGIPPREALLIDPQQRVFLELCWNALEHAGVDPQRFPGSIGVYAGTSNNGYRKLIESRPDLVRAAGDFAEMLANEKDYVATRVAHRLDLKGPALSIHTACSTSLVAVAQAWYALMSWQCDLALAGGINITVPQESGYLPVEGAMESEDGHCRPFDAAASGTVFSSGGAVVALKRLADAIEAGDMIWAVIRGVAVNNDGGDKASFSAPSVRGQAAVIHQAMATAGIEAGSIGYVEAHGTGTPLGDPIEIEALTRAFREDNAQVQSCWIGSLKGNVGHMIAASGVAGLIKAALALHHGRIPPTLHYRAPNPEIDFAASPFKVADHIIDWPRGDAPRRAGVSSFGVGGTNAHVVLEEAPRMAASSSSRPFTLLSLSARDEPALLRRAAELAEALQDRNEKDLADIGYTLALGRKPMQVRDAVVAGNIADARTRLASMRPRTAVVSPRLIFLFPGQGSQHANMVRALVGSEPVFREAFEQCCTLASAQLDRDLRALILPPGGDEEAADRALAETRYTQPALFAVEYALAELWESWGMRPDAMIGHSSGEYVAACRAGVFTLDDAIKLVVARGAAMFAQPPGAMLAVRATASDLKPRLTAGVEIAAHNAPVLTVVSGMAVAIDAFAADLAEAGVASTRLHVSHAFHSASMEGALPEFRRAFNDVRLSPPNRTFYSCVSGLPIGADEATSIDYWCRQLRQPVFFAEALQHALAQEGPILALEVGPAQALTGLTRAMLGGQGNAIASLGPVAQPGDAAEHLQRALGQCWCAGIEPDWTSYYGGQTRHRTPLPGYPFRGERYWIDSGAGVRSPNPSAESDGGEIMGGATPSVPTADVAAALRATRLATELRELFENLSGATIAPQQDDASFLELGLDSLALTQAALEIERRYGVKLKFRRLLEDLDSIGKLAALLDSTLPTEAIPVTAAAAPMPATNLPATTSDPTLAQLIRSQMALMQQQTQLLAALTGGSVSTAGTAVSPSAPNAKPVSTAAPIEIPEQTAPANLTERPFGASARIVTKRHGDITPEQRAWLDGFIQRYNARTAKSKAFSQQHRKLMADPRVVTGFNPLWKDLVYPIVVERSKGARMWDLDGNEYIDLLNGFGANFLGYQPDFIARALQSQIETGYEIGPQHPLTAEVAQLISDMTGMQRVAFCNTGSEAVMGAMRIARTVTGRKTIVIFKDSYHGIFDEVIVRGTRALRSIAAAPGILANAVENVLVLDYGSDEALRIIGERAHELAAVMIEPVQSRNPTLQPREFIQRLRPLCDAGGCALIFDEVITGFRVAQGGAQEFYDVRADIATYGKIIGGGLPFAAIAGSAKWMDALDGGDWRFGDDSYPETGVTYFAGTFVRHPLALAAAKASLLHLKQRGPALQRELNQRTAALVERLNHFFGERAAPLTAISASSLWRVSVDTDQPCASLFYYALRERGLHVYEQFNGFLSEAHGDAEVDAIAMRIEGVVDELMDAGILMSRVAETSGTDVTAALQHGEPTSSTLDARAVVSAVSSEAALPAEIPLTDAQLEKWVTCQFGGGSDLVFNESLLLTLEGALDRSALERALRFVTQRHEALTLSFAEDGSSQRVGTPKALTADFIDLSGTDAETRLAAHCEAAVRQPFDLTHAPLLRAQLLRLAPERHALLVVAHHLVFDGWSEAVFLDELAQAYNAFVAGQQPELAPAESYRAYVMTERARRADDDTSLQMDYWQGVYSTIPEPLLLPADRRPQREPEPDLSAATVRHEFSPDLVAALRQCARRKGVTLYSLLLAGFGVLLTRLSGQHDFAIGIPFAGQALAGSDHLIGDGVSTLPLRLSVPAQMPFGELAHATHRVLLDAAEHQDITLQTVLHELGLARGSERRRLAEVIFNLNPRVPQLAFTGLDYSLRDCAKAALSRELFFNLNDSGKCLTLDLHYLTALFDESTIRRWIAHYETLLGAAASNDDITVAALPLLTDAQRGMVLHDWNATAREYDRGASLPALITAQAARTPDHIAVECEGSSLSYAELERHTDAVARALISRGVGRGELVGVCLPRCEEMLVAVLGIMKSGGAYVPLDPTFPVERLRYMAEHSELRHMVVLRAEQTPGVIAQGRELLELATFDPTSVPESPLPAVGGDDLAYVLYTSGSTGQPKGVRILHRNLVNFLLSMRDRPGIGADDVLCAVTTLSFDIAGLELYLPLTVGARVVLATEHYHADADALFRLLRERGVTLLQTTPSLLRLLLDGGRIEGVRGLKLLIGGEALPRDLAESALQHCRELWNLYGPTETTIWSTVQRVQHHQGPVLLGTPIANTRVYVLDPERQPVPPGVIGEVWIGGDGVANGYQGRPDLTAERFVENPFVSGGSRMYRTGDLGSIREGVLNFHGRADEQIKLRGYRIEPGDIESVALADAGVQDAVAVARDFGPGDKRLVLYVAADQEPALIARLRDTLRERLPPYMLPQHLEVLQTLPRTANGKIDRKALPQPSQMAAMATEPPSGPTQAEGVAIGALELAFVEIWRQLLRVREVGIHDNFFDLGGDSLLAVRVFQRAQEITGVNLPLTTLLMAPTVAGQAAAFRVAGALEPKNVANTKRIRARAQITADPQHNPWSPLVPIQPLGTRPPLFCLHAVGGNVLNYVPLAKALGDDQPFYGVQSIGLDGTTPPLDSLPAMAERYLAEIRTLQPHGPYFLAGGSMGGMIAYEMACQLRADNEKVALLALFDTFGPGNRLFEIERAGSVEQMGYRWNDRLYRLRHASPGKRLEMLWIALRWRIERRVDRYRIAALRRRGKALPHALRYREIQRCNERAYFAYEPPPYEGSITLFRASEHPGEMKATSTLGWEVVVAGNIEVIALPGSHNDLIEQPALVAGLRMVLDRLQDQAETRPSTVRAAG